jgi:hypothetical protein
MRHILLPRPIATGTQRMDDAAAAGRLVAPSGRTLPLAPRQSGTAAGTIDLAAVAAAADEHLRATTHAHEQPGRRCRWRSSARTWTTSAMLGIMPGMRARHGVGHGVDPDLAV